MDECQPEEIWSFLCGATRRITGRRTSSGQSYTENKSFFLQKTKKWETLSLKWKRLTTIPKQNQSPITFKMQILLQPNAQSFQRPYCNRNQNQILRDLRMKYCLRVGKNRTTVPAFRSVEEQAWNALRVSCWSSDNSEGRLSGIGLALRDCLGELHPRWEREQDKTNTHQNLEISKSCATSYENNHTQHTIPNHLSESWLK